MAEVSIICKRTVVSTKPVQPGKMYSSSTLDCIMENNHLRVVYYYTSLPHKVPGELTRKLRESLSETLSCFPVVTGRLIKSDEGRWMIKCNDAGVRIVEARVQGNVGEWLHGVDREKELQLVHWEEMYSHKPYFWSTLYIQLSEFQGGGFAIGLSCTHLLADPICATVFIKAWADTNLGGKMLGPPSFHSLPPRRPRNKNINHKPYTELINYYKSSIYRKIPVKALNYRTTTVTLAFTDTMVRACMAMAGQSMDPSDGQLLSRSSSLPFAALAGLFWICLSRVKNTSKERLVDLAICLDTRKVLGLDRGFFGNCMVSNKVDGQGLDRNSLSEAAGAIGEVVGKMDAEGVMDLIEWLDDGNVQEDINVCHKNAPPDHCDLICINLEGDEAYSTVSGEGNDKPLHVSYYVEPVCGEGQVLILPWLPKEGPLSRAVMVTLPEDEVLKLLEDSLLQRFSPTILMGANKLKR